jgi:N-methylhydantoinase B
MTLSTHIDQEGIRLPPSLLTTELRTNFANATRTPDERLGDLDAQLAANHVGAAAVARIVSRHGLDQFRHYSEALLDYSQSFLSQTISAIPDGAYTFEDFLDDDGAGTERIPLRLTLTIQGDRATADFRASADQVKGCVNCPAAVTASAVYYCFASLLPDGVPLNDGCFRNITILTRPGSLLDASYPGPVVAGNTETSQRVVDVMFGALAKALPSRIPAASCGTMSSLALGSPLATGNSQLATLPWTYYETIGGGSGASPAGPGTPAIQCHMTNTLNTPAEALELQYPLRVLRFERAPHTGGSGLHPGGDGTVRELLLLAPTAGTLLTDRRVTQPYGLSGGHAAPPGSNATLSPDGTTTPLPGKCAFTLPAGTTLRITTPGGGGWGGKKSQ